MSDSTPSPCKITCSVSPECCDECHESCCDDGKEVHVHVHVHHHHHCCRAAPVKPVALPVIKFGYSGVTVGGPGYNELMAQINAPQNYGPSGAYNKIQSVITLDASKDIISSTLTAVELKAKFDVLSVGLFGSSLAVAEAVRLADYVALRGVLIIVFDQAASSGATNVLQQFGHTGPFNKTIVSVYSGVSSATETLSNYFGASTGVTLKGNASIAITSGQLPSGSRVLATSGPNILFWTVGNTDGRVVALSDVQLVTSEVGGTEVDSGQEKFLNNLMCYLFDKVLEKT